jgi:DNA-binding MarR family transcriptional regulator
MAQGHRFAELLSGIAREITLRQAADVCCGDLTLEQFQTLRAVSGAAQPTIGTLSTQLRVDLSTMSRNVTLLEKGGYLLRSRSGDDGRIVHVGITAKGKRALESLRCDERDVLGGVFDRVPPSDRDRVIKALETIRASLDATSTTGAACCPPVITIRTSIRKAAP